MPAFRHKAMLRIARDLGLSLSFEAEVHRGAGGDGRHNGPRAGELEDARRQIEEQRRELEEKDRELARLRDGGRAPQAGFEDRNIAWVFGSSRTGSTWLASMLSDLKGNALWNEPHVGRLFGSFYYADDASKRRYNERNFILGRHRESWLGSIRHFVLEGAVARFPKLGRRGCVVVKEPNGSIGAPLLSEALPKSRLILLVRDPRDAVASSLDASREGGWRQQLLGKTGRDVASEHGPDEQVRRTAGKYARSVSKSREAYQNHGGPRSLVRYEDLRAEPLGTMQRLCRELEIEVGKEDLAAAVERHSWENVPEERKGEGKQHRKAQPGGWQEDLTPEQARTVEEITGGLLDEFYPGSRRG